MPIPTTAEARARMAGHLAAAERELAAAYALVVVDGATPRVNLTDHHIQAARTAVETARAVSEWPGAPGEDHRP